MKKKKIVESQWMLIGNAVIVAGLFFGMQEKYMTYGYMGWLVCLLAIPFYTVAVITVRKNNRIIKSGKRVLAQIAPQSFSQGLSYRGLTQYKLECHDREEHRIHTFVGTFSVKNKDANLVVERCKETPMIEVFTDASYKNCVIDYRDWLGEDCYCLEEYFCPAVANYCILVLIVMLGVLKFKG
jgi:hypothetical protein